METDINEKINALQNENKTLKGKIRGYQTLGQLFQELKERNRVLEMELQNKEMTSVATETESPGPVNVISANPNQLPKNNWSSLSDKNSTFVSEVGENNAVNTPSLESSSEKIHKTNAFSSISSTEYPENSDELNLLLAKKLQDAKRLIEEYDRKRSNDKRLVKILNEEVKRSKDELHSVMEKLGKSEQENKQLMVKIARLEHERDNLPLNNGAANTEAVEAEATEDWVHLHQEMSPADDKLIQLQKKCEEHKYKANRWESEHFNLQVEYTKHVNDLRGLLECKSKELVKVTAEFSTEKRMLESKFIKLESMLKEEKDAKFEAYTMHQETMRKYKILEKKFLALEQNNILSASEDPEPKSKMGPVSDYEAQITMLEQQMKLFKEDFDKEQKERLIAQKQCKKFEEQLLNKSKQLEKKEIDSSKYEKSLKEEIAKNQKLIAKIKAVELNHQRVLNHNLLLMELQSKMSANQFSKPKDLYPNPQPATRKENVSATPMEWECKCCTYANKYQDEECIICKAPKFSARQGAPKSVSRWKCDCCTYINNYKADVCAICKSPRNHELPSSNFDNDLAIDGPTFD